MWEGILGQRLEIYGRAAGWQLNRYVFDLQKKKSNKTIPIGNALTHT
jgi:hypothetical protein